MKILYLTVSYESVQKHISQIMESRGQVFSIYLYGIRHFNYSENIPRNVLTYNPPWKYVKGPLFYLTRMVLIARNCIKAIEEQDIEIMHGNMSFRDGIVCRYIYKKCNIPYVVSFRDTDFEIYKKWKLPWIRNTCYKVLKDARQVIFISNTYKEALLKSLPKKLQLIVSAKSSVVPNGIDEYFLNNKAEAKTINGNPIRILAVGKVCKRKNPETTVEALKILKDKGYDCTLTLVGNIEEDNYRELIKNNDFIVYIEASPKDKILEFMRKSDILIVPSRTETFGLVYAEAMSQGMPVIYTRGQGFDGQYKEGYIGYSVDCNNAHEIAKRVIDILNNFSDISKNCIKESVKYDWSLVADEYIEIYHNAIISS